MILVKPRYIGSVNSLVNLIIADNLFLSSNQLFDFFIQPLSKLLFLNIEALNFLNHETVMIFLISHHKL